MIFYILYIRSLFVLVFVLAQVSMSGYASSDDDMDSLKLSEEEQKKIDALQCVIDADTLKIHSRIGLFLQKLKAQYDQEVLRGHEPNVIAIASLYEALHEDATNCGVINIKNSPFHVVPQRWLLPPSLLVEARKKQKRYNRMDTVDVMKTYETDTLYESYIDHRLLLQPLVDLKSKLIEVMVPKSDKEKEYDAILNARAAADGFKPFTRENCNATTAFIRNL